MGDNRTKSIVAVVLFIVLLIFLVVAWRSLKNTVQPISTPSSPSKAPTRAPVPSDAFVPEKNSTSTPADVARPKDVYRALSPSVSKATSSIRTFDITVEDNQFTPNKITVYQKDVPRLTVVAVDKDYDLTQPDYGFHLALPKGQPKLLMFVAGSAGKFMFYCEQCGGPDRGPKGYFVVVPK